MNPHHDVQPFDGPFAAKTSGLQPIGLKHRDIVAATAINAAVNEAASKNKMEATKKASDGAMAIAGKLLGDND